MSDYTLNIIVNGIDQAGPYPAGLDRLGVGGIAAGNLIAGALQSAAGAVTGFVGSAVSAAGEFEAGTARMAKVFEQVGAAMREQNNAKN